MGSYEETTRELAKYFPISNSNKIPSKFKPCMGILTKIPDKAIAIDGVEPDGVLWFKDSGKRKKMVQLSGRLLKVNEALAKIRKEYVLSQVAADELIRQLPELTYRFDKPINSVIYEQPPTEEIYEIKEEELIQEDTTEPISENKLKRLKVPDVVVNIKTSGCSMEIRFKFKEHIFVTGELYPKEALEHLLEKAALELERGGYVFNNKTKNLIIRKAREKLKKAISKQIN